MTSDRTPSANVRYRGSDLNKPTRQFVLNVVVVVKPGAEAALETLLRSVGAAVRARMKGDGDGAVPAVDFGAMPTVHYARWVMMPGRPDGAILALNTWYDGPVGGEESCDERRARALHLKEVVA